jgi:hypothetical protein
VQLGLTVRKVALAPEFSSLLRINVDDLHCVCKMGLVELLLRVLLCG